MSCVIDFTWVWIQTWYFFLMSDFYTFSHKVVSNVKFIEELNQRANSLIWQINILTILVALPGQVSANICSLLTLCFLTLFQDKRAQVLANITLNARDAQLKMMCYSCIMISLTEKRKKKITNERQNYCVDDKCLFSFFVMLFKVLMNKNLLITKQVLQCTVLIWSLWMSHWGCEQQHRGFQSESSGPLPCFK